MTVRNSYRFSLAPMMKRTDRHMRYFFRLLSRHALLYTEMLNANAIAIGERYDLLAHDEAEYPLACQLGGSEPKMMGCAARIAAAAGYSEVNMNVGCPSPRVQNGDFGACLMKKPALVGDCLRAMQSADADITMKCRIGVDDYDSYEFLRDFIGEVTHRSSVQRVIIHARIAKLQGLSPKQNREIPPLNYERVYRLAKEFSDLQIILNGGIANMQDADTHSNGAMAGVMVGRAAIDKPFLFADCDRRIFGDDTAVVKSRAQVFGEYLRYCEKSLHDDVPPADRRRDNLFTLLRPLSGLFHGIGGAKQWRHKLNLIGDDGAGLRGLHDLYENFAAGASA